MTGGILRSILLLLQLDLQVYILQLKTLSSRKRQWLHSIEGNEMATTEI